MLLHHDSYAEVAILKTVILACSLLAFSAFAAELPVTQPVYGPASRDQYDAAVASDGDQYLVVWGDERSEIQQAFATRVSRDGTVLDPNGIRVASGALTYNPYVIWSGSSWFVLSNTCSEIDLVRVARNGVVLDAKPRALPIHASCPGISVATDGNYVVVGYVTGYPSYEEHALFLNSDGDPVADIRLSAGESVSVVPAIGWNGSAFVAVWEGRAVGFDPNGTLGSPRSVSLFGSAINTLRIASDGKDFVVVRGNLAFRMSADLVAEPLATLPFASVKSIAWTGSSYVIAGSVPNLENGYLYQSNVNIVRLDRDGHLLAQREVRAKGVGAHPGKGAAVATNGQNVLVAWHDPTDVDTAYPDADTYASVVSLPELTPEPRKLLSVAADWQLAPLTAASGINELTVWRETTGLYARRHWPGGATDNSPILLTKQATSAAVVFNGSDFIVASTEGTAVTTRRVPANGELRIDGEWHLDGGTNPRAIALASSGAVTLVAWYDTGVSASRVGAEGALIDRVPLVVAPGQLSRTIYRIAISPNGAGEFLVVWGGPTPACDPCSPSYPEEGGPLRAARVTPALTLLDPVAIKIANPIGAFDSRSDSSSSRYDPTHSLFADDPSVTSNGNEWLVVWDRGFRDAADGPWSTPREEIRGRRIARNGTVLDGSADDPGVLIAQKAFAPTVAWTGSGYLLGWYEGSPTYRTYSASRFLQRIHTASLDHLGATLSNDRIVGESPESDPISLSVANGLASIGYSRLGDDSRYGGVSRAFLDVPVFDSRRRAVRR